MSDMSTTDVANLIAELAPAPSAWVQAAQALPALRASLDELVELCRADQALRARTLADLERALGDAGVSPEPHVVRYVRLSLER
jgi:hypothetical protein